MLDVTLSNLWGVLCLQWVVPFYTSHSQWLASLCVSVRDFLQATSFRGSQISQGHLSNCEDRTLRRLQLPCPTTWQSWSLSKQALRASVMRWTSSFPPQSPFTSPPSLLSAFSSRLPGITSCIGCLETKSWIGFQGTWDLDGRLQSSSPDSGLRHWILLRFLQWPWVSFTGDEHS